ncbi:MAG: hypothetical protein JNM57_02210 [Cyclobacteriaceae bacterium]|nr:hypothetical protein [Cyclobacteriaceae bacterium]
MKRYMLGVVVLVMFFGCDTKEKERMSLQKKVDSLSVELTASKQVEANLNEVGVLLDSIDASRKSLQIKMTEGSSYADYVTRLKAINTYVQETQTKLTALEKETKNSKATASSIRRLKADLEKSSAEIVALQLQLGTARDENMKLWAKSNQKDSILSMNDQIIRLKESDIASLEKMVNDTNADNKLAVANLYYKQAEALELAASRTHFAPRKRKETRREALELYKLSHSLGNREALKKVNELEDKLS